METPANVIGASTVSSDLVNNLPRGPPKTHHNNRTSRIKIKMCKVGHFSPCFQIKKNGTLRPQLQNKVTMITTMMGVIIIMELLMILVLKMTKKYHITWYWCQDILKGQLHGGKRAKRLRPFPPPPYSSNARKKTVFLMCGVPLIVFMQSPYEPGWLPPGDTGCAWAW